MGFTPPSITASGTTFAQFQAGGASGHLEKLIAAQAATAAPTAAPTATATGGGSSGGLLAAGAILLKFTETNGIGETTVSPESATLTVGAGNIPQVTFPTLKTGNTARNLYATAPNGTTGQEVLYASGITTTTFSMAIAAPSNSYAVAPPTTNSTSLIFTDSKGTINNMTLSLIRAAKDGNLQDVYRDLRTTIYGFNRGNPMASSAIIQKLRHIGTAFTMLATLCNEAGTLVDANAGTLTNGTTGIGNGDKKRVWP